MFCSFWKHNDSSVTIWFLFLQTASLGWLQKHLGFLLLTNLTSGPWAVSSLIWWAALFWMCVRVIYKGFKGSWARQDICKWICESSLTLCSCQAEEITSLLQGIRRDSSCLEGVLTLMQDGESSYLPFFPILLMMLQIEPSMRPTARWVLAASLYLFCSKPLLPSTNWEC